MLALVLAAGFLFATSGTVYATESVKYVEKSWDRTRVVSETKTEEALLLTSDTEYIQGRYYVRGTIESSKRLKVVEGAEAHIILMDGCKLTLKDGINVHHTSRLNIYAQSDGENAGELICYADTNYNAAIGSNDNSGPNGPITIHGGKVTADAKTHGTDGAGIGGGNTGAGGTVIIYGGKIDARGGNYAAGIGSGDADGSGRDGGTVTIYGGDVTATGGKDGAGIGGGEGANGGNVTIWGGNVTAIAGQGSSDTGAGIGSGDDDGGRANSGGTCTIHGGDVHARGGQNGAGIGGGDRCDGGTVTIDGGRVVAHGSYYGAGIGGGDRGSSGDVTIAEGSTVTAFCGDHGAGIGGGNWKGIGDGKRVLIKGGDVYVHVGGAYESPHFCGAGIGGGSGSKQGGDVIIEGGNVSAESWNGAGIGGGGDPAGIGGNVTISGGTVAATSRTGAGIGGGGNGGSYYDTKTNFPRGGNVTISGGGVFASSTGGGAAIGGGMGGDGGSLTITDGYVVAITSPVKYDWTDHYAYKQSGPNYNAIMASVIASLLMKELVSNPVERSAAAIGGGFAPTAGKGGAAGYFKITGGLLIAKSGRAVTNAIGPADFSEAPDPYTNYVYNSDMWVSCSDKVDDSVTPFELKPVKAANRGQAILDKPYVMIEKCPHASKTYSADSASPNCHDYSCEYCGRSGSESHNWVGATYSWNSDYSTVTAAHTCADCRTIDIVTVNTSHWEEPSATCLNPGKMKYEADYSEKPGFDSQYKYVEIPSRGHHEWEKTEESEGQDNCGGKVINYKCKNCGETKIERTGGNHEWDEENWTVLFEPTCTLEGERYHKCNKCDALNLDSLELVNALGHEWGDPTYEWADDKKTVTAKRVCKRGCVEEETATVFPQITKSPTCTEDGEYILCAEFLNKAFKRQESEAIAQPAWEHEWGDPTYVWSEDNSSVTADRYCKHNPTHVDTETVGATSKVTKEPTQETDGERVYTSNAFNNPAFTVQTKTVMIPAGEHVHDWAEPTYTWSEDNSKVTAERVCNINAEHKETEIVDATSEVTTQPTCASKGETTYTAEFTKDAFKKQTKKAANIDIVPDAHDWNDPTYEWADDYSTVTAKRVCKNDPAHIEEETVDTQAEDIRKATCKSEGEKKYTASFSNPIFKGQEKTIETPIDPSNHKWNEGEEISSQDICGGKGMKYTCNNCSKTKIEGSGEHEWEDKWTYYPEPTCTESGQRFHKCKKCDAFNFAYFEVLDPLGHDWGEPSYTWAADNSAVTAKRVCKRDPSHVEEETVNTTSKVSKKATCTSKGETTYTAAFENEAFKTQTKTVANIDIDSNAHDWNDPTYKWEDDYSKVTATRVCKNDPSHVETKTVNTQAVVTKEATCVAKGRKDYTASFTNQAFKEQKKTVVTPIDPRNHDWDKGVEIPSQDICGGHGKQYTCRICEEFKVEGSGSHDWETAWTFYPEPTCTESGQRLHKCKKCDAFNFKDGEFKVLPPTGHDWGKSSYTWSDNYSTVTAKRVCKRDASHAEEEKVKTTTKVIEAATCEKGGENALSAEFENAAFEKQTKSVRTAALGHQWSEWVVTKEPTTTEKGEEVRTCSVCKKTETRAIPKIDPTRISYRTTDGDQQTWYRGSGETADFTFKRSMNDEETFSHFTGIRVDGRDVDRSDYTAESGSVIVKLKPAYLETLSTGEHTITALFDDGNGASAKFTVVDKNGGGRGTNTGDSSALLSWLAVMLFAALALTIAAIYRRKRTRS